MSTQLQLLSHSYSGSSSLPTVLDFATPSICRFLRHWPSTSSSFHLSEHLPLPIPKTGWHCWPSLLQASWQVIYRSEYDVRLGQQTSAGVKSSDCTTSAKQFSHPIGLRIF